MHPDQPNWRSVIYPIELLRVLPGQVVPLEKMNDSISRNVLLANSVEATERYKLIRQQAVRISTGDAATFLQKFGVTISGNDSVEIHSRKMPKIMTGSGQITPEPIASWFRENDKSRFIAPSTALKNWVVAYDDSVQEINAK